jgi:hypothetical protein
MTYADRYHSLGDDEKDILNVVAAVYEMEQILDLLGIDTPELVEHLADRILDNLHLFTEI